MGRIVVNLDVEMAKRKISLGQPLHPKDRKGQGRALHHP